LSLRGGERKRMFKKKWIAVHSAKGNNFKEKIVGEKKRGSLLEVWGVVSQV